MTIPLLVLFALGYILSRVLVRVQAHTSLLGWITRRIGGSPARLCLGIMGVTFVLSLVLSNMLTVLAMIPVVQHAVDRTEVDGATRRRIMTLLGLGVIYGANIGGVGSLIGSPANIALLGVLDYFAVPGADQITFLTWMAFGLPAALVLMLFAWAVLSYVVGRHCPQTLPLHFETSGQPRDRQRGLLFCGVVTIGCVLVGVLNATVLRDENARLWPVSIRDGLELIAALVVLVSALRIRLPESAEPLLTLRDLVAGLPLRGVAVAIGAGVVGLGLAWLGQYLFPDTQLRTFLPAHWPMGLTIAVLVTATIFTTEVVSNTAAAAAFWAMALGMSSVSGASPLLPMIGISLASTCAFMSPLATPATGLAFGGLRGISLRQMMIAGGAVNIVAALWLCLTVWLWVPWVLGL